MTLIFLNGAGMRGGALHHQLQGAPLVQKAYSAAKYRFFSVADRFPAMHSVTEGGHRVHGEIYRIPLETLHHHLLPAEPAELELGTIELADGRTCLATVLRKDFFGAPELIDISHIGDWRVYQAGILRS
ncbi:MAG TPA: gamma-glutamylcyclotransferase [Pseudonocardiaceae bacterium]|jgi:gamma-glutamylcyclotransferase (GGCT)/AIG2-like uncharacterized protein YtfP|nr:gamma-glutamylcyclotransferase [Pseudonocardiaceae bacterium]